ncbi:hypothetical protein ACFLTT_01445 [Chloroflexota bacterium]
MAVGKIPDKLYFYLSKSDATYKVTKQLEHINKDIPGGLNSHSRILINSVRGTGTNIEEGIVGTSLYINGIKPTYFFCEKVFKNCDTFTFKSGVSPCNSCYKNTRLFKKNFPGDFVNITGILDSRIIDDVSELSKQLSTDEILNFEINGIHLGNFILASLRRYFLSETIPDNVEGIIRSYFITALDIYHAAEKLSREYEYLFTSHGVYVSWGIMAEVFYRNKKKVITWGRGYRQNTWVLAHKYTYHKALFEEGSEYWSDLELDEQRRKKLNDYMMSKRTGGSEDFVSYNANKKTERQYLIDKLDLDMNKKIIVLFTNVVWDASVAFTHDSFGGMYNWLLDTIDYFAKHKGLQLIIRVHPAEVQPGSETEQKASDIISKEYGQLPNNIKLIDSEHNSDISSYGFFDLMDAAIIYGSKIGVELAYQGIPTIVAGEAFCKNKGITFDVLKKEDYYRYLDNLETLKLSEEQKSLAIRYAYYYNFIRLNDIDILDYEGRNIRKLNLTACEEYNSSKFPQYNRVIDSIINTKPFHSKEI